MKKNLKTHKIAACFFVPWHHRVAGVGLWALGRHRSQAYNELDPALVWAFKVPAERLFPQFFSSFNCGFFS